MIAIDVLQFDNTKVSRTEFLKNADPHIWAEYTLFPTSEGGKSKNILCGWGCPCFVEKDPMSGGFDGYPLLGNSTMSPSESRYLGIWFMNSDEAIPKLKKAGSFFLWEGGFIGKAVIRPDYSGMTVNERLFEAGLFDAYDKAVLNNDNDMLAKIMKLISI